MTEQVRIMNAELFPLADLDRSDESSDQQDSDTYRKTTTSNRIIEQQRVVNESVDQTSEMMISAIRLCGADVYAWCAENGTCFVVVRLCCHR